MRCEIDDAIVGERLPVQRALGRVGAETDVVTRVADELAQRAQLVGRLGQVAELAQLVEPGAAPRSEQRGDVEHTARLAAAAQIGRAETEKRRARGTRRPRVSQQYERGRRGQEADRVLAHEPRRGLHVAVVGGRRGQQRRGRQQHEVGVEHLDDVRGIAEAGRDAAEQRAIEPIGGRAVVARVADRIGRARIGQRAPETFDRRDDVALGRRAAREPQPVVAHAGAQHVLAIGHQEHRRLAAAERRAKIAEARMGVARRLQISRQSHGERCAHLQKLVVIDRELGDAAQPLLGG